MDEKDFIILLDKTTYFAAFNMLSPEMNDAFMENIIKMKVNLREYGDNYSEEVQNWALKLLMRESIDNYINMSINTIKQILIDNGSF